MIERYLLFGRTATMEWGDLGTTYTSPKGIKHGINKFRRWGWSQDAAGNEVQVPHHFRAYVVRVDPASNAGTVELFCEVKDPNFNG